MKIFISHQRRDEVLSRSIANRLKLYHGIDSYLDVIDPYIGGSVELLADHIRSEMGKCSQLLAVVSSSTVDSQWVPWEIGVATEKDFPLATYSGSQPPLEFLRKWPYLRSDADLDAYAKASKAFNVTYAAESVNFSESFARSRSTKAFYTQIRRELGQ